MVIERRRGCGGKGKEDDPRGHLAGHDEHPAEQAAHSQCCAAGPRHVLCAQSSHSHSMGGQEITSPRSDTGSNTLNALILMDNKELEDTS